MPTLVSDFDYDLPEERIAQSPATPRDSSRLLVLDRNTGEMKHETFRDIVNELNAGDLLVMNDTKVFKARLRGRVGKGGQGLAGGKEFEVFLLRAISSDANSSNWSALLKNAKRIKEGTIIDLDGLFARVVEKGETVTLNINASMDEVLAFTDSHGEVPVPPYVEKAPEDASRYQTVYAEHVGSVAAPTAGFHFTPELIENLKAKGVDFAFVTLHVGIGTFRPMKTETLEEHQMHSEFVRITPETAAKIHAAKSSGRRVIAVGTTTVRALEGSGVPAEGFSGDVNMFINPGFEFKVIDGLITNFHLPKSTLLVLVSAFAGREPILAAYKEAIAREYRFYSFGDAMFIR